MKEFTERHHAFIAASFYALLVERFEKRGEAAFVHATQRYAEQRGGAGWPSVPSGTEGN